ncbi:MAG: thioredoxin-dependent thiol peroxidase [Bacteroidota bacterium]
MSTNAPTMPAVGTQAPAFSGTTQDGSTLKLADFAGERVVLYFYPKDDTPGCTKQACNLRDHWSELQDAGFSVIGISPDSVASHGTFAGKYDLPFPLVADEDHSISTLYGTWGEKNFYGKKIVGMKRTTFLINEEGEIVHVFKRPKTAEHTQEILKKYASLEG